MKKTSVIATMILFTSICGMLAADSLSSNADTIWIENAESANNETVVMEVHISAKNTAVDAITMKLDFDSNALKYIDCEKGDLDPNWVMFQCNETNPGEITVGAFTVKNEISAGSVGSLVRLNFKVTGKSQSTKVTIKSLSDDLANFDKHAGEIVIK